ncbi:MAG: hypothetical protein ACOX9C_04045 [Kiritimatiellia bacterium]
MTRDLPAGLGRRAKGLERHRLGSQLRCLQMTSGDRSAVAEALSALIEGVGEVRESDLWAPQGLAEPDEIRLDEARGFLKSAGQRDLLKAWWITPGLMKHRTPPWDLVSTCRLGGVPGLMLVEAKAHLGELNSDPCSAKDKSNIGTMRPALDEAAEKWNDLLCALSKEQGWKPQTWVKFVPSCHYELACRFAFALKIAEMGVPVALVYLGFLDAEELEEQNFVVFRNPEEWHGSVIGKTKQTVPEEIWGNAYDVVGVPLSVLIRSARVQLELG